MSTLRVEALEQPDGTAFVFNNKNLLINGGHNIWQRSTSASVSSDTYHTVDRWQNGINGMGVFTVSRSTDVPSGQGFGYSCKYDCTTADASPAAGDYVAHYQKIEGQNLQHLLKGTSNAKAITVSFWVKSNKTGTYIVDLYDNDNSRHISRAYTIDSASTWEKKTLTFPGDTTGTLDNDNAQSMRVVWWMGAGSNYTSGTLQTSWGSEVSANRAVGVVNLADSTSNEWYITGCQMEVGSTASGFEFEPYAYTLQKCQRYFELTDHGADDIPPSVVVNGNGIYRSQVLFFKVEKRDSATCSQRSAWTFQYYNGSSVNMNTQNIDGNKYGYVIHGDSNRTTYQALGGSSVPFSGPGSGSGLSNYVIESDAEL